MNNLIECKKCGRKMKMITVQHLKNCSNITLDEYKKEFPNAPIIIENLKDYRIKNCKELAKNKKIVPCSNCGNNIEVVSNHAWTKNILCNECSKPILHYGETYLEDEDKVICQICWRAFDYITFTHVNLHKITLDEYRDKFPDASIMNKKQLKIRAKTGRDVIWTIEAKENASRGQRFTLKQRKKIHSLFCKIEELKEDLEDGRLMVRCKNSNCKNSKEKDGWFKPTVAQIADRVRCIEKLGNDGCYFYCSEKCKNQCILYNLHVTEKFLSDFEYSQGDYETFRQEVLKRQQDELGYNECEMCGCRDDLHVHHEKPQKTHPILSLDPDNGIILCGGVGGNNCHNKYGHADECSSGNLKNIKVC